MTPLSSPWQKSKVPLALEFENIHVWNASTQELAENQTLFASHLNPAELTRAEKFVFDHDRQRFILVRGFLRHLLGLYLQLDPKEVTFEYSAHGKPEVSKNQNTLELNFNLSDSKELMLLAIGSKQNLGVDVEFIRHNLDIFEMAKNIFTENEYKTLSMTLPEQQYEKFFTIWTRKEAFIKNIGLGLYYPLQKVDVIKDVTVDTETGNEYRIFSIPVSEGYKAALVTDKNMIQENISYLMWTH